MAWNGELNYNREELMKKVITDLRTKPCGVIKLAKINNVSVSTIIHLISSMPYIYEEDNSDLKIKEE